MLLTVFFLLLLTVGGVALSYLYEKEEPLLVRLCIGHVIGSTVFGTVAFVLALASADLTVVNSALSITIATLPAMLFRWDRFKNPLTRELKAAVTATQGFTAGRFLRLSYYLFFLLLFIFFFDRAMIVKADGIFTGASQNYGDLSAHLGAIYAFTDGGVFPPENPSYSSAKFTYPFIVDFITAALVKLGSSVQEAMYVHNVSLAFSLLVLLERFLARITGSATVGKVGSALFFFSGGLGFVSFFSGMLQSKSGWWDYIWKIQQDYTIGKNYRWGNPMVVLLITQRSFLLGMPITLMALVKVWGMFKKKVSEVGKRPTWNDSWTPFVAGLITGTLPLVHVHSLAVVFITCAILFFFSFKVNWWDWAAFAVGVSAVAIPELLWIMTGSASNFAKFIEWQSGWEDSGAGVLAFWLRNTGIAIPMLLIGFFLVLLRARKKSDDDSEDNHRGMAARDLLVFYSPFLLMFLLTNFVKLAPWGWDNIKVMIYWFIASLSLIAYAIVRAWRGNAIYRGVAVAAVLMLCLSGAIDVWRVTSHQIEFSVFDKDGVAIANDIRLRTPHDALFLNAPIHNPPLALTGRRSLMRSAGHLFSYGIDYKERVNDVSAIYAGGPEADSLLAKHSIEYALVGPQEKMEKTLKVNEEYFKKFQLIAERGDYKVYKIR